MALQALIARRSYLRYAGHVRFFLATAGVLVGCGPKTTPSASGEATETVVVAEPLVVESQPLVHPRGLGPWNLGMARHEVLQAFNCQRFIPERNSGGFQCSGWESPMGPRKVSFVFDESYRLSKLQLWLAEQDASGEAAQWGEAVWGALQVLSEAHEPVSPTHPELLNLQKEEFVAALAGAPSDIPFSLYVDVAKFPERGARAWMTAIATPQGRYAFLFVGK